MIEDFAAFLPQIATVAPAEFDRIFHDKLDRIDRASRKMPENRPSLMRHCFELCSDQLDQSEVHRHGRHKPFGYAGDFQMIDWIYTYRAESPDAGMLWDNFFHRQHAPRAVRNRKNFFISLFKSVCASKRRGISVLNLASGPCRDVAEAIRAAGPAAKGSTVHCIDNDERAIEYAYHVLSERPEDVTVELDNKNVLAVAAAPVYDLVWSAGLFDYLDDRIAAVVLRKMWRSTRSGGTLAVGNFQSGQPGRNYVEWCGDWFLRHRTQQDLAALAARAGIPEASLRFHTEPLGACIFMTAVA